MKHKHKAALNSFPFRKFSAVSFCMTSHSLKFLVYKRLQVGSLLFVVSREAWLFYHLQSHNRPVNDLSTAVKLTNRLLRFWTDGGFVSLPRVTNPLRRSAGEAKGSFYIRRKCSQSAVFSRLVPIPHWSITSSFAIALAEIRTSRF